MLCLCCHVSNMLVILIAYRTMVRSLCAQKYLSEFPKRKKTDLAKEVWRSYVHASLCCGFSACEVAELCVQNKFFALIDEQNEIFRRTIRHEFNQRPWCIRNQVRSIATRSRNHARTSFTDLNCTCSRLLPDGCWFWMGTNWLPPTATLPLISFLISNGPEWSSFVLVLHSCFVSVCNYAWWCAYFNAPSAIRVVLAGRAAMAIRITQPSCLIELRGCAQCLSWLMQLTAAVCGSIRVRVCVWESFVSQCELEMSNPCVADNFERILITVLNK